jgi:hypothetical protein
MQQLELDTFEVINWRFYLLEAVDLFFNFYTFLLSTNSYYFFCSNFWF